MAEPPDRLARILAYKREEVAELKRKRSLASLETEARAAVAPRGFAQVIQAMAREDGNALICEVKRQSPSAGDISPGRDPVSVARDYAAGGAACISVLTDAPSFGGSLEDLVAVRAQVDLPVLRKDFMVDTIQIVEARAAGADAVLIIMAALEDTLAGELHAAADALGMSVLLEAHDAPELERALRLPSPLVGVNNRNLKTFETDLAVTEHLAGMVPPDRVLISESGVRTPADVARLRRCGARGFLVGEALMRTSEPISATAALVAAR